MTERVKVRRPDYMVTFVEVEEGCSGGGWRLGDDRVVRGLEIRRTNFGTIRYLEPVKVANLEEVDDIVFINHKEVILYPEERGRKVPPVGEGLNCAAEVILERVWPSKNCTQLDFEDRLRKVCERQDTEFISYCEKNGFLKFKVKHFSKYSCNIEEDDEDEEHADGNPSTGNPKPTAKTGLGGIPLEELKKQQDNRKKALQTLSQPLTDITDSTKQVNDQCNQSLASEDGKKAVGMRAPGDAHVGGGDAPFSSQLEDTPVKDIADELMEPLRTSTPVPRVGRQRNGVFPLPGSTLLTPSPSGLTPLKPLTSRNPSSVLRSSESLKSQLMKKAFMAKDYSKYENDFLQETPAKSLKSQASNILFKDSRFIPARDADDPTQTSTKLDANAQPTFSRHPTTVYPFVLKPKVMDVENPITSSDSQTGPPLISAPIVDQKETEFLSVNQPGFQDLFKSIRPKENRTNCKLFGAPRVCFARSGHFITVENLMTSTGFKRQAKISCLESYSEKLERFPFSESYRDVLKKELMKQMKEGDHVLFKEYAEITKEQLKKANLPTTREFLKSELIIWELCEILWPEEVIDQNIELDDGFLLTQRNRLSEWLMENAHFIFGKAYNAEANSIFGLMKKGKIDESCEKAIAEGNDFLAVALAASNLQIDCTDFKEAFEFFPQHSQDILNLCCGSLALEELTAETVTNMWSCDWLQYFSLYLWYHGLGRNQPVDLAILSFEEMMRNIVGDDEAPLPKVENSCISTMCVHLLKLYSCTGYPLKNLLTPLAWTSDILDYKLSWLLMMNLETIGYVPENEVYANVCVAFAGQLETIEMPEWAVFVTKYRLPPEIEDDAGLQKAREARDVHEMRLLEKCVESGHDNLEAEVFLKTELAVDEQLIYSIKAEKASTVQRYDLMIGYYHKVGRYQEAFNVFKEYLDVHGVDVVSEPGTKIDGYYLNVAKHLLTLNPFRKNIIGWEIHGKLMMNYFKLRRVEKIRHASPASSSDFLPYKVNLDATVLGFMEALSKYHPENKRQSLFLVHLTLTAQKAIEQILADEKVACTTKDAIKNGLVNFMNIPVPKEYFDGFLGFINDMVLNDICTQTQLE